MRNALFSLITGALLTALFCVPCFPAEDEESLTGCLAEGNTEFALKLYGELRSGEENIFFSPFSVSSAMAMAYSGARQNTAKEMKEALCFHVNQKQLPLTFKLLNSRLSDNAAKSGQKLSIANGLCLTGGDLSLDFKALLRENFDAEIFKGDTDAINSWVNKKTEGKIPKILESLGPNSICVLLNAIYFKGTWEEMFKPGDTRDDAFFTARDKKLTVRMMSRKGRIKLLSGKGFQAASLPYKGGGLSMVILLPDAVDGLQELEKQLTADNLKLWLRELDRSPSPETILSLPKFKLETEYDVVPSCRALGIKDAFDSRGNADFSGMGWKKGALWISQIKHKAFVEVNEEGTEAAAATAVVMQTTAARKPTTFRADHPFFFLIRDNMTGTILFLGRVTDPSALKKGASK